MRASRALCLAAVAAVVLWVVAAERGGLGRPAARPNVLLVSIDSLRADHLGAYGYPRDTSPTIDALARQGVVFEWAISSAPWTIPAHATMLTGLPPEVHGVNSFRQRLAPEAYTLAEALQQAGYATAAFVSGPTVMAQYGFDQGFAFYDESMAEPDRARSSRGITSPGLVTLVGDHLERWHAAGRQAPFFVFLHMWDVHYDYAPPAPYDRMFDPDYAGDVNANDFERNARLNARMDPRDLQHVIALYDGEIRFTDEHLGRIVAQLAAFGVLDDTIVAVTSDHGDEFFEHGMKGHAKTLYDEVLHVPLVVRYPRRIAFGQRVAQQVRLMDLPPTILGLAGVPVPEQLGNRDMAEEHRSADLTSSIAGRGARRPVPALPAFSRNTVFLSVQESVRTPAAKLIRRTQPRAGKDETYLFDLVTDAAEQKNLAGADPAPPFAAGLDQSLAAYRDDAGRQTALALKLEPTPKHEARLRALGYVE